MLDVGIDITLNDTENGIFQPVIDNIARKIQSNAVMKFILLLLFFFFPQFKNSADFTRGLCHLYRLNLRTKEFNMYLFEMHI